MNSLTKLLEQNRFPLVELITFVVIAVIVAEIFGFIWKKVSRQRKNIKNVIISMEAFMILLIGYLCLETFVTHNVKGYNASENRDLIMILIFIGATLLSMLIVIYAYQTTSNKKNNN